MSTRVCLIVAGAWLVLAAHADAQVGRSVAPHRAGAAPTQATESENWPAQRAAAGEPVSNAPRTVSYAAGDPLETPATTGARGSSPAARRADQDAPMPLPPRSDRQRRQPKSTGKSSSGRALVTVLSSLAIVLAVFFAFVWLTRSAAPKGMAPLSKDVVESLGRAPLLGRQQMQLIRVGNKLVLLSVTSTGADTLTEITDPVEVDRLAGLCRQAQSGSISDTFRQVLAQAATEPAASPGSHQRQTRRTGAMEPHRA